MNDQEKLISLMFSAGRLIRDLIKTGKYRDPFSHIQLETLRFVEKHHTPTMKDIAKYLCVKPSSATAMTETMVRCGLLKRLTDAKDRRVVKIALTPRGRKALDHYQDHAYRALGKIFKRLDGKDAKAMIASLEKIVTTTR